MSEDSSVPATGKSRKWLKIILFGFVFLVICLAGVFFYVNSGAFIRGQVFTRVESELNQPVTAGDINFSVFSGIEIDNFTLGDDPLLKADKVKVGYDLMSIINGDLVVNELLLDNATMNVVVNRDGKLNILSKRVGTLTAKKPEPAPVTPQAPPVSVKQPPKPKVPALPKDILPKLPNLQEMVPFKSILLSNIKINNLNLRFFKDNDKSEKVVELKLKDFNFELPELKNGADFEMALNGALECVAGSTFNLSNGKFSGTLDSGLAVNFQPEGLNLDFKVTELAATSGQVALPVKDFHFETQLALGQNNLRVDKLRLATLDSGSPSEILLSGKVTQNDEIDLKLAVKNVNAALLDLAAPFVSGNKNWRKWQTSLAEASQGKVAGFGETVISYDADLVKSSGIELKLNGKFNLQGLPLVKHAKQKSIANFGVEVFHDLALNPEKNSLVVQQFSLGTFENGKDIVDLKSDQPISIDLATGQVKMADNAPLEIALKDLNLDYARTFIKEEKLQGLKSAELSMTAALASLPDKKIKLSLSELAINNISVEQEQLKAEKLSTATKGVFILDEELNLNINNFIFSFKQFNENLISAQLKGGAGLKDFTSELEIQKFAVSPKVEAFLPKELKDEFGLGNINLTGETIKISYKDGDIGAQGKIATDELKLGGKVFNDSTISQETNFKVQLGKDKNLVLENVDIKVNSNRFAELPVEISGNFELPVEGKVSKSAINLNVPSIVDVDQLLTLLKEQKPVPPQEPKNSAPPKDDQPPVKPNPTKPSPEMYLVFNSKINGVRTQGQEITEIETKAVLDKKDFTLEKLRMLVVGTPLNVTGKANLGTIKKADFSVNSEDYIDISPVNTFINKGTARAVTGNVKIESIKFATQGATNEEFLDKLVASGVVDLKDIKLQNYAEIPGILATTADLVLGVNPALIHFTEGKFDIAFKDKLLSLNECRVQGKSLMANPKGTIAITDTGYDLKLKAEAGFGGGQLIQSIMGVAGGQLLQQLAGKSSSMDRFNQNFQYSDALKLFTLKNTFNYEKVIPFPTEENKQSLTADFLTSIISYAAEVGKMKNDEVSRLQKIASGKGNVLEELLGFGIDKYNDKNGLNDDENKNGETQKKKGLFDQILDIGINELDKRDKKKQEESKEEESKEPEKKKEDDPKKELIDGLIRGIFN